MEQLHDDAEADSSVSFLKQKHVTATWCFCCTLNEKMYLSYLPRMTAAVLMLLISQCVTIIALQRRI